MHAAETALGGALKAPTGGLRNKGDMLAGHVSDQQRGEAAVAMLASIVDPDSADSPAVLPLRRPALSAKRPRTFTVTNSRSTKRSIPFKGKGKSTRRSYPRPSYSWRTVRGARGPGRGSAGRARARAPWARSRRYGSRWRRYGARFYRGGSIGTRWTRRYRRY